MFSNAALRIFTLFGTLCLSTMPSTGYSKCEISTDQIQYSLAQVIALEQDYSLHSNEELGPNFIWGNGATEWPRGPIQLHPPVMV